MISANPEPVLGGFFLAYPQMGYRGSLAPWG